MSQTVLWSRPRAAAPQNEEWRRDALCAHESPDLFFPLGHSEQAERQAEEAKRVCEHCQVRDSCLAWALDFGPSEGVFGGTDPDERRAILHRR